MFESARKERQYLLTSQYLAIDLYSFCFLASYYSSPWNAVPFRCTSADFEIAVLQMHMLEHPDWHIVVALKFVYPTSFVCRYRLSRVVR
jgi:hypothetical protein